MSFFISVGAGTRSNIKKLFQWDDVSIERTIRTLIEMNFIVGNIRITDKPGDWFTIKELID